MRRFVSHETSFYDNHVTCYGGLANRPSTLVGTQPCMVCVLQHFNTSSLLTLDRDCACFWKTISGLDLRFDSSSHRGVFPEKQAAFITALGEQMFNPQGHSCPLRTALASLTDGFRIQMSDGSLRLS